MPHLPNFGHNREPILKSKSIRAIFSEKVQKRAKNVKKGQKTAKYLKIWSKMYKI